MTLLLGAGGKKRESSAGEGKIGERKGGASQKRASGLRQRQPVGPDVIWDSPEANYRNREGRVRTGAYSVHGDLGEVVLLGGLVDSLWDSLVDARG